MHDNEYIMLKEFMKSTLKKALFIWGRTKILRINGYITEMYTNKLSKNKKADGELIEKISSGKRINRACDDAAGTSISQSFKAQVRGLSQAERNVQDGISLIQVTDGALDEITENIHRMREIAVQAANGSLTDKDRECVDEEFQQLKQGIEEIAKKTEFNNIKVIDGAKSLMIQIKAVPFTAYRVETFDANLANLGIATSDVQNSNNAENALQNINDALEKVLEGKSKLGADLNSLEHSYNDNTNANLNLTSSLSRIEDLDIAGAFVKLVKGQVISKYSEAMSTSVKQDIERVATLIN